MLAEYPNVCRVRLDGPVEARIAWVVAHEHLDEAAARRAQRQTDRVRAAYIRHLYGTEMTDPSHFDLYIDTAAIDTEACVDLLEEWVRNRPRLEANSSERREAALRILLEIGLILAGADAVFDRIPELDLHGV